MAHFLAFPIEHELAVAVSSEGGKRVTVTVGLLDLAGLDSELLAALLRQL